MRKPTTATTIICGKEYKVAYIEAVKKGCYRNPPADLTPEDIQLMIEAYQQGYRWWKGIAR